MILTRVREFLRERRQASLEEIALHCHSQPQAVRGMLDVWIRKGRVVRQAVDVACGGSCRSCDCKPVADEVYVWQDVPAGNAGQQQHQQESRDANSTRVSFQQRPRK